MRARADEPGNPMEAFMNQHVSRRSLTAALAGGTAMLTATAAVAAAQTPVADADSISQHPLERLREIADEAAELMAHYNAAAGKPFELRIQAAATTTMPVAYFSLKTAPQDVWDNYRQRAPAPERLKHHLLSAAMTVDEMVAEGEDWQLFMAGTAGVWKRPKFALETIDPSKGYLSRDSVVCRYVDGHLVDECGQAFG